MWTSIAITLNINGLNTLIKSKDCQNKLKSWTQLYAVYISNFKKHG